MSTPINVAKHPIHPMLVVFPIGLWIFSFVSDLILVLGGSERWSDVAFYTMAGGLIGALLAAVSGLFDMFCIADPKARKIAWNHMICNLIAVAIFALDLYFRTRSAPGAPLPIALSAMGITLLAVSGWLGGELVYVHGIGVSQPSRSPAPEKPASRSTLRRVG